MQHLSLPALSLSTAPNRRKCGEAATRVRTLCAKAWGDDGIWDGIPETAATAKTASESGFGKRGAQRFAVAAPIPQKRSFGRSWALQILERPISVGAMPEN
jgi:hypothetical protein